MGTKYRISGGDYFQYSEESLPQENELPARNFLVDFNENSGSFYLRPIEDFELPKKLYGKTVSNAKRILSTYKDRPQNTGVLLAGEKGSGKSLLAKQVCLLAKEQGMPTIVINQPYAGNEFSKFLQDIDQECVILFDEFEKTYAKGKDAGYSSQAALLSVLDGIFPSKKLFVLTANDKWSIDTNMHNRPGRIFYSMKFGGIDKDFVKEYCDDNLKNKGHIKDILLLHSFFDAFNFDQLQALVEEMNRYGVGPTECIDILNIKVESTQLYVTIEKILVNGVEREAYSRTIYTQPLVNSWNCLYYKYSAEEREEFNKQLNSKKLSKSKDNELNAKLEEMVTLDMKPEQVKEFNASNGTYHFVNGNVEVFLKEDEARNSRNTQEAKLSTFMNRFT